MKFKKGQLYHFQFTPYEGCFAKKPITWEVVGLFKCKEVDEDLGYDDPVNRFDIFAEHNILHIGAQMAETDLDMGRFYGEHGSIREVSVTDLPLFLHFEHIHDLMRDTLKGTA